MISSRSRILDGSNKVPACRNHMSLSRRAFALGLLAGLFLMVGCRDKPSPEIIVGAASSMRHVLPRMVAEFEKEHPGQRITVTYGASGDVARQVEAGAGVDVVVFAGKTPLDKLVQSGHVDRLTTKIVGTNELVLVGAKDAPKLTFASLDTLPTTERLAIGDPKTVPVGQYAQEALERLALWDKLQDRLVLGANVAAVLAYLPRGEVTAAIVYRTEVQGVPGITVLDVAKGPWAPRPEIWTGVVAMSHERKIADEFARFLASPAGARIFLASGFGPP